MTQPILIIEDDPDGQAMVAHVVNYLDIPHDVASDGETAIEYLLDSERSYQAVIIDLALPGKDGWEVLADIRENSDTKDLLCIAVTAFHTSKIREETIRAGFDAYFPKPLDATQFSRALAELL